MTPWWQGAVIYQIYPRSYLDTDGDGVGDLEGIRRRLDYVRDLGADAIWLSPITPSPNEDFGYDVSDYTDVAAEFGGMAAFDRVLEEAHARGIRVILDQVLSHTSDRHPWFQQSLLSRDGDRSDWYVWADARADGTPPNNWLAAFGGPAWTWHPVRCQYYFHQFLKTQPKLNFHNPRVVDAVLDVLRFWLDRGVDGFRLDVANSFVHDAALADNTPVPPDRRKGLAPFHPPRHQYQDKSWNQPENVAVMRRIRALVDSYGDRLVFGEFAGGGKILGKYAGGKDRLHTAYTFDLLEAPALTPAIVRQYYEDVAGRVGDLFPCVTFSNHDVPRPATKWRRGRDRAAVARQAFLLLMTLRGTALTYQGEELGLDDIDVTRAQVRDPFGLIYFPYFKGRDGCRSPMPWTRQGPHAGFTTGTPWLPVGPGHPALSVAAQEGDAASMLAFARRAIALRHAHEALRTGGILFEEGGEDVLSFRRGEGRGAMQCAFNLGDAARPVSLPPGDVVLALDGATPAHLPPLGAIVLALG